MNNTVVFDVKKNGITYTLTIPIPCRENIEKYCARFHNRSKNDDNILLHKYEKHLSSKVSDYELNEMILIDLFNPGHDHSLNTDLKTILIKVTILNAFYNTWIDNDMLVPMARLIYSLHIDDKLQLNENSVESVAKANCDLVNAIAYYRDPINKWDDVISKKYSFASKYCSWHCPDLYPIVDSYAKGLLIYFNDLDLPEEGEKEPIKFEYNYKLRKGSNPFNAKNRYLNDYHQYYKAYMTFIKKYKLKGLKLKMIDEYLWSLAQDKLCDDNCCVSFDSDKGKKIKYSEYIESINDKKSYPKRISHLVKAESYYPDDICEKLKDEHPSFKKLCDDCFENSIDLTK